MDGGSLDDRTRNLLSSFGGRQGGDDDNEQPPPPAPQRQSSQYGHPPTQTEMRLINSVSLELLILNKSVAPPQSISKKRAAGTVVEKSTRSKSRAVETDKSKSSDKASSAVIPSASAKAAVEKAGKEKRLIALEGVPREGIAHFKK